MMITGRAEEWLEFALEMLSRRVMWIAERA